MTHYHSIETRALELLVHLRLVYLTVCSNDLIRESAYIFPGVSRLDFKDIFGFKTFIKYV